MGGVKSLAISTRCFFFFLYFLLLAKLSHGSDHQKKKIPILLLREMFTRGQSPLRVLPSGECGLCAGKREESAATVVGARCGQQRAPAARGTACSHFFFFKVPSRDIWQVMGVQGRVGGYRASPWPGCLKHL